MARELSPSELTRERQRRAADPAASAWVSANAGSGKTHVLANRVMRLLLSGVEPSKILCLTFTRAAAAHMSNTVFRRLGAWATMPEADLARALHDIGENADRLTLARARKLFARALDTPGGLKVLTIHAFCEKLLHQFPFEARVAAAFTVLDDRQRAELITEARNDVLTLAVEEQHGLLGSALSMLVAEASDGVMLRALNDVLWRGEQLNALMRPDGADASARVRNRIEQALGVGQGETQAAVEAEILGDGIPQARWSELIGWLRSGTPSDHKLAACLEDATKESNPQKRGELYLDLCLTKDRKGRSDKAFVTKKLQNQRRDLYELLLSERKRLVPLIERRRAAAAAERSFALLVVADAIWQRYRAEKARRGVLDFADLIAAAKRLLKDEGAAWVHYKLDEGIDHILVDEAQDTSPDQWEIVERLTSEFTAGAGARDVARTVFAVGDEKQSIFGFQGAAPDMFASVRGYYRTGHEAAGLTFNEEPLNQSFRTAADVLTVVDRVFKFEAAHRGLTSEGGGTLHDTARRGAPGEVQVWPLLVPDEKEDDDKPWFMPLDAQQEKSPLVRNAVRIAHAVKGWTEGRDALGPCAPVPEGQILILVRNRGPLFEAILRELKARNVRVAGADRLDVGKHIAALDLLALADCLLLPDDDLALAGVLKSPLFGFDDDDLLRLAPERKGSLRRALREAADEKYRGAYDRLASLARDARRLRPFDFYAGLIGAGGARKAYRARLGGEVDDVLDEFLRLAMTHGESETATLAGFAAWMRAAPAEIKRDLETAGNDVRVMTAHGAKGLEARLVVLADFGAERAPTLAPCIYEPAEDGRREGEAELLLWSRRKKDDPATLLAARDEEKRLDEAEHRRLLYVALTRAEDRLIIAGHKTERIKSEGAWYTLVADALTAAGDDDRPFAESREVETLGGTVLVYGASGSSGVEARETRPTPALPGWLTKKIDAEAPPPEPLSPSRALEHVFTPGSAESSAIAAKDRGTLLHRLLEELPRLDAAARRDAAQLYLARVAADAPEAARMALIDEALWLLEDPLLVPYLAAGRAEVPVAGVVSLPGRAPRFVSGQIDRLVVEDDRVLILDFKSDRPVPGDVPDSYAAQLALYRVLLSRVYPGRRVDCALLWTAAGRLDGIAEDRLDAALDRALRMPSLP